MLTKSICPRLTAKCHDLPQCDDLTEETAVVGSRHACGIGKCRLLDANAIVDVRLPLRCFAIEYFTNSAQQHLLGERLRDEVGLRSQGLTTFTHVRVSGHV